MARIDSVSSTDLPPEYRHLFLADTPGRDREANFHRAVANNARVLGAWTAWLRTLFEEVTDARRRGLTVLGVAVASRCRYVWQQHVPLALETGLTRSDVTAIERGRHHRFDAEERAVLEYATALTTDSVDGDVHDDLSAHLSDDEVVAVAFLASEFGRVARLVDAFDVELEAEFVGWSLDGL